MASNIVPGNIDGTYPKAGQDNSSQGLRDNFSAIKTNFTTAQSEISNLQTNKASLNGSSNFANNEVTQAKFKDTSETVFTHGTQAGGAVTLDHENGHYQTLTVTADTTFTITNFPASGSLGRIILDVTVAPSSTGVLTFPSAVIKADFKLVPFVGIIFVLIWFKNISISVIFIISIFYTLRVKS